MEFVARLRGASEQGQTRRLVSRRRFCRSIHRYAGRGRRSIIARPVGFLLDGASPGPPPP